MADVMLTTYAAAQAIDGRASGADVGFARVTTDSREYCTELAERLATLPGGREEAVRSIAEEGLRLCDKGHPRAGVAKLRRAIRAARHGE